LDASAKARVGRFESRHCQVEPAVVNAIALELPLPLPLPLFLPTIHAYRRSTWEETRHLDIPSLENQAARHATSPQHRNAKSKGISLHLDMHSVAKLSRPVYALV
jgi:hypothetical protein